MLRCGNCQVVISFGAGFPQPQLCSACADRQFAQQQLARRYEFTSLADVPSFLRGELRPSTNNDDLRERAELLNQWRALQGLADFLPAPAAAAPSPIEPPAEPPTDPDARRFAVLDFE